MAGAPFHEYIELGATCSKALAKTNTWTETTAKGRNDL